MTTPWVGPVVVVLGMACGDGSSGGAVVVDSAGIRIVTNDGAGSVGIR